MENDAPSEGKDPSAFLSEIIGAPVTVKLNSGVVYKGAEPIRLFLTLLFRSSGAKLSCVTGELQSVDGYMNIALEKTEEYVNGVKKRSYGDAFVRGNNGDLDHTVVKTLANQRYC
jgi:small nuclear ribonucleoprotein (snRNP)-like protein